MMEKYVVIEKAVGETPLQALDRLRAARPELAEVPLTYAGRLDPMAEGKLLVLIGEECKRKDEYLCAEKTYEFEVLFGVTSDSGDILGMPLARGAMPDPESVARLARELAGEHELAYPLFSSKKVEGKQLFEFGLRNEEVELPTRRMSVIKCDFMGAEARTGESVRAEILERIRSFEPPKTGKFGENFRRPEVIQAWERIGLPDSVLIARLTARVGSGTYIRALAPFLGAQLGTSALAYSIRRTEIHLPRNLIE